MSAPGAGPARATAAITPDSARQLARNFTRRYVFSLGAIALLAMSGQLVVQINLGGQESDSRVVNLAGRQRMLSQRLAKAALGAPSPARTLELRTSLTDFKRVHRGLVQGDPLLGLPGRASPVVAEHLVALQPHFEGLVRGVEALLAEPVTEASAAQAREIIRTHEQAFVRGMDIIVFQLDLEATERVALVERLELTLFSLTLLVLFLEATFVFRPAVNRLFDAVTALVRARDALARTEAEQEATLSAFPDGLARLAGDGRLLLLKPVRLALFGGSRPAGAAIAVDDQPPALRKALAASLDAVRTNNVAVTREVVIASEGSETAYELRVTRAVGAGYIVFIRDITEQRRLEAEVLDVTEQTQARVGRELHDGLCQHLAGLALLARTQAEDPDRDEVVKLLEDGVAQARELALGLYPATLSNLGLQGALEELARHIEKVSSLVCTVRLPAESLDLPNDVALQLYRIAQEATANVMKHAQATAVVLRLEATPNSLELEIEDNGRGFEPPQRGRQGLGLDTMRYRARLLNGDLSIVTRPSGGTLVRCTIARSN